MNEVELLEKKDLRNKYIEKPRTHSRDFSHELVRE
jgi:hypothetical protein